MTLREMQLNPGNVISTGTNRNRLSNLDNKRARAVSTAGSEKAVAYLSWRHWPELVRAPVIPQHARSLELTGNLYSPFRVDVDIAKQRFWCKRPNGQNRQLHRAKLFAYVREYITLRSISGHEKRARTCIEAIAESRARLEP